MLGLRKLKMTSSNKNPLKFWHVNNYPLILRILEFWIAPHLVGQYIIPGFKSLPQYHMADKLKPRGCKV